MENPMADHFLSFMIFIFEALFLETLKFQFCHYFSVRWLMNFHGTKSKLFIIYVVMDLRVAILRFSCISIFSMIKTQKIQKNGKNYCKKMHFVMIKILTHQNLKIATLRSIST